MSKKKAEGKQVDAISRVSPFVQTSFDLKRADAFAKSLGSDFKHFKAMPSPIGQKDRGDYRRSDGVDTITSNGMIYKCGGEFTATMTDNTRSQGRSDGGMIDPSQSRLVMPRFYNKQNEGAEEQRIYLAPGDRIYNADPDADVFVANYQKMDYVEGDNIPLYPIVRMDGPITDSLNHEYVEDVDYCVTAAGNICWKEGGKNPGIDPDTGRGRIYTIRYLYRAYWYVMNMPKEVRITGVTTGGVRSPERMAYHVVIVREFVFHNQNKGDELNQNKPSNPKRVVTAPVESTPSNPEIVVNMDAIGDNDEE